MRRAAFVLICLLMAMPSACGRSELEPLRPAGDASVDLSPTGDAGAEASPADGSGNSEAGTDGNSDAAQASCTMAAGCPTNACEIHCCPEGPECAPCCFPKSCQNFTAAACPLDGCQVMVRCDGISVCYPKFSVGPPPCGGPSSYRQDVDCCAGLSKRCGVLLSNNSCDLAHGGYNDFPLCLPCGDGTCDAREDRCTCPEDCD